MARRNPRMELYDVPGCGHAPTLMARDQIETVAAFLTADGDGSRDRRDSRAEAVRRATEGEGQ